MAGLLSCAVHPVAGLLPIVARKADRGGEGHGSPLSLPTLLCGMFRHRVGFRFFYTEGSCERCCCRVQRDGRGGRRSTGRSQVPEGVPQGPAAGARHPKDSRVGAGRSAGKVCMCAPMYDAGIKIREGRFVSEQFTRDPNHLDFQRILSSRNS